MNPAREEIMKKLRTAVHQVPEKPDFDLPIYHSIDLPLELAFKENLEKVNGFVHLFTSEEELFSELKKLLSSYKKEVIFCNEDEISGQLNTFGIQFQQSSVLSKEIEVGITGCEFLIAHTGSVMVSSAQKGGRQMFVYPPLHIVIAKKDQLVDYLEKAYSGISERYAENFPSQIAIITGPSRTADIEKTLVLGAHGPRELRVFLA
ncbi:MAG TPA: LUD domain-containing protein [Bacteroidia bacterium]|nr:LUD domain-containing protein [Bacteroidia bacterium]